MIRTRRVIFFLLSVALLIGAAIYNGFPLIYSDSGTYIFSGFKFEPPVDRPITYGLFIYLTSLGGSSLWFTIIAQSAILSWLIREMIRLFIPEGKTDVIHLSIIATLCAFSGLSTVTSQLIPDIFTPIMGLALFLFLFASDLNRRKKWTFLFIVFLSCAMHTSNLLIAAGTIILLSAASLRKKSSLHPLRKSLVISFFTVLSASVFMLSSFSKSSHVFQLGRLAESGTLQAYLADSCTSHHYNICDCKDSIPMNADDVIWSRNNSVLAKAGGWQGSKSQLSGIIHNIYFTPHYLWMQVKSDAAAFCKQLVTFGSGEGLIKYGEHIPVRQALKEYFPSSVPRYLSSAQCAGKFDRPFIFDMMAVLFLVAAILALLYFIFTGKMNSLSLMAFCFVLIIYALNCLFCSSLVTVAHRFGCRVIWLFPFLALLISFSRSNRIGNTTQS